MSKTAFKIVTIDKYGTMYSPISYAGLAVRYTRGRWAKAKKRGHYLFVYKTMKDAFKMLRMIEENRVDSNQSLVVIECQTVNLRKAVGGGPISEYRCTRLKPIRIVAP